MFLEISFVLFYIVNLFFFLCVNKNNLKLLSLPISYLFVFKCYKGIEKIDALVIFITVGKDIRVTSPQCL